MFREALTESKSKTLYGDLQVAWNKYLFNLDTNPSNAETFQKKAYKLWKKLEKIEPLALNSAGKLWKDIIDADIGVGGRSPKIKRVL